MSASSCDILFITSDTTDGGIQRALIDWAAVIAEYPSYRVASISPENRFSHWLARHHPDITNTTLSSWQRIVIRHLPSLAGYFFPSQRAKIAFVHNGFACAAAKRLASHVIGICHNDKPHHFSAADQLICLTPSAITLAKQQGWTDDQLIILPHYHDCQHETLPARTPVDSFRVSAAGRFVPKKNFHLFISIAAATRAQRPEIQFTLAGDGPLSGCLKQACNDKQAGVTFTGWSDLSALARETDLFILPSLDEPFGYVLAEMMDAGVAIAATPTSGADYLLDGGKIAPLIAPDDIEKWVEIIVMLADNPDMLEQWRTQNFQQIRRPQFSRSAFSRRLKNLIDNILRG